MALREWCNRFGAADLYNKKRANPSPDPNNNREPKAKRPRPQNKQDTKKIWGAKSVSPEVKDGPKVTVIPRTEPSMKVPPAAPIQPKPVIAPMASTSSAATQPQQKVQIVRSGDGKIQVRGLLPDQQLMQMPDGKIQILANPNAPPKTYAQVVAQQLAPDAPQQQEQIVAQQLAPGAPIPPGHTAFVSGGKTYTIPKSVTAGATGIQIQKIAAPATPTIKVTAQLLQTAEGPRIVLQGIQGLNLPKEDLAIIQLQVKNELLKANADAKQQNKMPPTKIVIDLPQSIQAKLQATEKSEGSVQEQPPPQTIPSTRPSLTKPPMKIQPIEPPANNKDEDVKPFICTSCKKTFNNKACQTM